MLQTLGKLISTTTIEQGSHSLIKREYFDQKKQPPQANSREVICRKLSAKITKSETLRKLTNQNLKKKPKTKQKTIPKAFQDPTLFFFLNSHQHLRWKIPLKPTDYRIHFASVTGAAVTTLILEGKFAIFITQTSVHNIILSIDLYSM